VHLAERFLVKPGSRVRLRDRDPDDTAGLGGSADAKPLLEENLARLQDLQYLLYAENRRAVLVIFQAMDAGGKDGTIRHVLGPLNPQGVRVTSFRTPTEEELAHDFLWRIHRAAPRHGEIGVFNRSHYEDVLIVRVRDLVPKRVWSKRYVHINAFEAMLADSGVVLLKCFLHISKEEQLRRFRKRVEDPSKYWKANLQDFDERKAWDDYTRAYEAALSRCSTERAPWFVIPANKKWFRNLAVSQILRERLEALKMAFPKPSFDVSTVDLA